MEKDSLSWIVIATVLLHPTHIAAYEPTSSKYLPGDQ